MTIDKQIVICDHPHDPAHDPKIWATQPCAGRVIEPYLGSLGFIENDPCPSADWHCIPLPENWRLTENASHTLQAEQNLMSKTWKLLANLGRFALIFGGAALVIYAAGNIESPSGQSFSDFRSLNDRHLAIALAGLGLFFLACLSPKVAIQTSSPAPRPPGLRRPMWITALRTTIGAVLVATGLGLWVYTNEATRQNQLGLKLPGALFGGMALLIIGTALIENHRRSWFWDFGIGRFQNGLPWWKRDWPWLTFFLLVWFTIAIQNLDNYPAYFGSDESLVTIYGRWVYAPLGREVLTSPWFQQFEPILGGVSRSLGWLLFPDRPYFGPRLVTLCVATLMLLFYFLAVRTYLGRLSAWLAMVLFGTNHIVLHFSRGGYTNVDSVLLFSLWTLALGAAWRTRRVSMAFLCGGLMGAALYTYPGSMVLYPATAATFGLVFLKSPRLLLRRWPVILGIAAAVLVMKMPRDIYHANTPHGKSYRFHQVYILGKEQMNNYMQNLGAENVHDMLLKYSWPVFGGYFLWPEFNRDSSSYGSAYHPMLGTGIAALSLLGLAGALALTRRRFIFTLLLATWGSAMVLGNLLTIWAPYSPRLLVAFASGIALAAWAQSEVAKQAARLGGRWLARGVATLFIAHSAYIAYDHAHHYYVEFIPRRDLPMYDMEPVDLMEFVRHFPKDGQLYYFFGGYSRYGTGSSTFKYFHTGFDLLEFNDEFPVIPEPPAGKRTAYLVKIPERESVLQQLREKFPETQPQILPRLYRPDLEPMLAVVWIDRTNEPAP